MSKCVFSILRTTCFEAIQGVVERARNVSVWKEFATEAIEASKYAELGSLLVRLHAVSSSEKSLCHSLFA